MNNWGGKRESNPQPSEPQSGALPVELFPPPEFHYSGISNLVSQSALQTIAAVVQVEDGLTPVLVLFTGPGYAAGVSFHSGSLERTSGGGAMDQKHSGVQGGLILA